MAHELVNLAVRAIDEYLESGTIISPPEMPEELEGRAGVFVSLKKNGALRGCIGTFIPSTESIGEETIRNAISAAVNDPRFSPVRPEELPDLECSVDVLSKPEPASEDDLDPRKYGVIVEAGQRRGLLLPALEGVDTVSEQIEIAKQKAGILPEDPLKIFRFSVRRYT